MMKKMLAYVLLALGFCTFLPRAQNATDTTTERLFGYAGFALVAGGFGIYSSVLKKEILEEVKKQSLPPIDQARSN